MTCDGQTLRTGRAQEAGRHIGPNCFLAFFVLLILAIGSGANAEEAPDFEVAEQKRTTDGSKASSPSSGASANKKQPARQVPVEMFLDPEQEAVAQEAGAEPRPPTMPAEPVSKPAGENGAASSANAGAKDSGHAKAEDGQGKPGDEGGADFEDAIAGEAAERPGDKPGAGSRETAGFPGLPRRKPRKPNVRRIPLDKAGGKKKPPRGGDRNKYLCQALQACRNDFVRCKSKIEHPDQSPAWIDAKEACGAVYKECVQQHFQPGEWFFTRWFYFQELDCK